MFEEHRSRDLNHITNFFTFLVLIIQLLLILLQSGVLGGDSSFHLSELSSLLSLRHIISTSLSVSLLSIYLYH